MQLRSFLLLITITGFLSSCSSFRPGPTASVPTSARPEDVAAADAFFKTNQGRGMIPDAPKMPTLTAQNSGFVIELDQQRVYFYHQDQLLAFSKLSSGRPNYRTETGSYVIGQKDLNHRSTLYGNFVSASGGSVMMSDVTQGFDPRPVGGKFQGSLMKYFQRFNTSSGSSTAMGFHTGVLPGSPASHGCVRLPDGMAAWFFKHAPLGTPVMINGTKYGVPRGTAQKRSKREPKIHSSLKKVEAPAAPTTPPAGAEAAAPPAEAPVSPAN
jgi:lipoprotein-anchoring transpeptidase ErfK/SrfK